MAALFIDVLRSYVFGGRFKIHDFVVMPDHFHLLITLDASLSIERAVQLIKGNFSFRAKRELGTMGEIWQRGRIGDILTQVRRAEEIQRQERSPGGIGFGH